MQLSYKWNHRSDDHQQKVQRRGCFLGILWFERTCHSILNGCNFLYVWPSRSPSTNHKDRRWVIADFVFPISSYIYKTNKTKNLSIQKTNDIICITRRNTNSRPCGQNDRNQWIVVERILDCTKFTGLDIIKLYTNRNMRFMIIYYVSNINTTERTHFW